jgi:hypothetical protein
MNSSFNFTRRAALLAVGVAPLVSWSNQPVAPVVRAQAAINTVEFLD